MALYKTRPIVEISKDRIISLQGAAAEKNLLNLLEVS